LCIFPQISIDNLDVQSKRETLMASMLRHSSLDAILKDHSSAAEKANIKADIMRSILRAKVQPVKGCVANVTLRISMLTVNPTLSYSSRMHHAPVLCLMLTGHGTSSSGRIAATPSPHSATGPGYGQSDVP